MYMAVRDSIFASKGEERGFRSIEDTWSENYTVYPQIPLSALFTPDPNWPDTSNFFFKTSVDYVLCTIEGRPILAIDFDGEGGGYDRDGKYIQVEPARDRNRKRKFDIKLHFSQQNNFPYHIVSSQEFSYLGEGINLTVVDGIIGSVISKEDLQVRSPSILEEYSEEIENQPPWYKSEFIQDLLVDLEFDCDAEHSRIFRKTCELMERVHSITGRCFYPYECHTFEEPELPTIDCPPERDPEAFNRRIEALKRVGGMGMRCYYFRYSGRRSVGSSQSEERCPLSKACEGDWEIDGLE